MKAQCHLKYLGLGLDRKTNTHVKIFTHENKGKKYPYSSDRQNNRKMK